MVADSIRRVSVRVRGIVQGVGFRPFIYRLAGEYGLAGWVLNDEAGVLLEVEGPAAAVAGFLPAIRSEAPAMAVVDAVEPTELAPLGEAGFRILASPAAVQKNALISPDIATCADCRRELLDPANRRYGYAFTNCTNCGPRYSIIRSVPYDRPQTTMAVFPMCADCRQEYENPADRRFHAQPNACAACGPSYELRQPDGRVLPPAAAYVQLPGDLPVLRTAHAFVAAGKILAVKGIGGYHLACDARSEAAAAALRARKHREDKPFAVLCGSLAAARSVCEISAEEEALLQSPAAPIVLLKKKPAAAGLAAAIAPGNPWLGVMLPYAPVHHLLLAPEDIWVMTSANISDEPIAYQDADAGERLSRIADAFLVHNRVIAHRVDDSVMRLVLGAPYLLRRSRGLAPLPIHLAAGGESVLACGAELKNTFCVTKGELAFVSEHIGDLANQATLASYEEIIAHYEDIFAIQPRLLACDLHPEYLSTKYARERAKREQLPLFAIQHHHAHIAAVLAEHGLEGPVLGVSFDGTGYGTDGCIWGGEFMQATPADFTRLAHFRYLPLPGGERAAKEPWRQALWVLQQLYGEAIAERRPDFIAAIPAGWQLLLQAAKAGLNAPLTSSAGRVFDTAAALLGVRLVNNYEGQAAVELELLAMQAGAPGRVLPYEIRGKNGIMEIDFLPVFAVLSDGAQQPQAVRAALAMDFHATMAALITDVLQRLRERTGLACAALAGGVFQNKTLLELTVPQLADAGFTVLLNRQVPPNDGGLALGQAAAALAKWRGREHG